MNAIILVGDKERGKTTALRKVINAMLDRPKEFCLIKSHFNNLRFYDDIKKDTFHDCYAVFEFQGKKILVITYGDAVREIETRYQNVKNALGDIDLLICASHPKILDKILARCNIIDFNNGKRIFASNTDLIDKKTTQVAADIMDKIETPFANFRIDI